MNLSFIKGVIDQQYDDGVPVKTASENVIFAVGQKCVEGKNFKEGFMRGLSEAPEESREKLASLMQPKVLVPLALEKAVARGTAMGDYIRTVYGDKNNG